MKNIYACPHCGTVLNPSVKVLLVAKYKKQRGMILLSPQPGNFRFICDESLGEVMNDGDLVDFFCPVCAADLVSPSNRKFAALDLLSPGRDVRRIEFSREFGKHATFIIDGQEVVTYGEDATDFQPKNFFGS